MIILKEASNELQNGSSVVKLHLSENEKVHVAPNAGLYHEA